MAFFGTAFYTINRRTEIQEDQSVQYLHSLENLRDNNGLQYLSVSVRESVEQDLDAKIKDAKTPQTQELLSQESHYHNLYGESLLVGMAVLFGIGYYAKRGSLNDEVRLPSFR